MKHFEQRANLRARESSARVRERGAVRSARPRCLVTDLHAERGLSRALCRHLELEMDSLEFTAEEIGRVDTIWVCGYRSSEASRLLALRRRYPQSRILVTGARRSRGWQQTALDSGADDVRQWPLSTLSLKNLLLGLGR